MLTDLAGQDWLVYHAIDRAHPYLDQPFGVNRRPLLIDRLDWIGGWPVVRAGKGASEGPQTAPVTTGPPADRLPADRRVEADLRVHAGATGGLTLPRPARGRTGVIADGMVDRANVSAAPLYRPVTRTVPEPRAGAPLPAYSDEFGGSAPGAGWTWTRRDPAVTVSGGSLNWPVEGSDLVGGDNTAGVLTREAPRGAYVVETKLTLDLGQDTVRNYQQAGLIAYAGDDDFARLDHVAIQNTRQVEFGRELPYAGGLAYGGTQFGTAATTMWLRLAHRIDPATGEHEFRAGSSRDGRHWVWSGVWTFSAGGDPRIGLVAQGGAQPTVTARFDYLRVYRG